MELQTLQGQLKVAIQNHQIVVGKMRKDPQSTSLQKQLHDLQSEIMNLSDKQKQVVQQLRKDLDKKQNCASVPSAPRRLHSGQQSVIQKSSVQTQALSLTTKPTQATTAHQIIQHVVPSLVNNLVASATFKTPIATAVLLPNTPLLTGRTNENHVRSQPLLVVPTPAIRPADGQHSGGVVFNLAPPIRVPQYPPPNCRTSTCQTNTVTSTVNACNASSSPAVQSAVKERRSQSNFILSSARRNTSSNKIGCSNEQVMNFISALGLVTKDALSELQSKRVERKRRTTANPQFSNAAIEEKRKNAAALLNTTSTDNNNSGFHVPFKRPRGRPRNNPTPPNSRPTTPDTPQQSTSPASGALPLTPPKDHGTMIAIAYNNHRSPREIGVVNGFHPIAIRPALPPPAPSLHVPKDVVEELCAVCRRAGDLLTCFSCKCAYHSKCLQSPLTDSKPWHCPKCHTYQAKVAPQWTETVAVVHSYIAIKAAKEEEKNKLLKRSLELKSERTELEEKKKHLNSVIAEQRDTRTQLEARHKKSQDSLEKLHQVVSMIQQVS